MMNKEAFLVYAGICLVVVLGTVWWYRRNYSQFLRVRVGKIKFRLSRADARVVDDMRQAISESQPMVPVMEIYHQGRGIHYQVVVDKYATCDTALHLAELGQQEKVFYVKARQSGLNHLQALYYALT